MPQWSQRDWRRREEQQTIRKRRHLEENSFLDKEVDLLKVNLNQLISGKHLTVLCTLLRNEVTVQTYALADTEANRFTFINTLFTVNLAKYLNMKAQWLLKPLTVKGYNGQNGNPITHILCLHLKINGQRQYNLPLLILDLGNHDLILGWGWLVNFWILVDAANCHLQWSEDLQPSYSAIKEVVIKQTAIILISHSSEH